MEEIFKRHDKAVLQFSGGKDSLACLNMCRPWLDKIVVVWVNTSDAFPETIALMKEIAAGVPHFLEVCSDQPNDIAGHGWPVDVIPVRRTSYGNMIGGGGKHIMRGYPLCCGTNIWAPMERAVASIGATLVIRGTKKCDARKSALRSGDIVDGIEYQMPVFEWTSADVDIFLDGCGVEIPSHYISANGYTETSLDCMHCTAYLDENKGKMEFMREKYPSLFKEVRSRLGDISGAIKHELSHIQEAML